MTLSGTRAGEATTPAAHDSSVSMIIAILPNHIGIRRRPEPDLPVIWRVGPSSGHHVQTEVGCNLVTTRVTWRPSPAAGIDVGNRQIELHSSRRLECEAMKRCSLANGPRFLEWVGVVELDLESVLTVSMPRFGSSLALADGQLERSSRIVSGSPSLPGGWYVTVIAASISSPVRFLIGSSWSPCLGIDSSRTSVVVSSSASIRGSTYCPDTRMWVVFGPITSCSLRSPGV